MAPRAFRVRFQVSILSAIVGILLVASISILAAVVAISADVGLQKARQLFREAGFRVEETLDDKLIEAAQLARLATHIPGIDRDIPSLPTDFEALPFMLGALESYPALYSIYAGHEDGSFVQLINARHNRLVLQAHAAPMNTSYILRYISAGSGAQIWTFLNSGYQVIGEPRTEATEYLPTTRPWFELAMADRDSAVLTLAYVFDSLRELGITAAHYVQAPDPAPSGSTVVGVDITLTELDAFVEQLDISPGAGLVVFNSAGEVLAASERFEDWAGQEVLPMDRIFDIPSVAAVLEGGDTPGYLSFSKAWETVGGREYQILAIAPEQDFLGHLLDMQRRITLITALLLVLAGPITFLASRKLSNFLVLLAKESERIRQFDFSGPVPANTSITEFEELSAAFALMKSTIASRTAQLKTARRKLERIIELGVGMATRTDAEDLVELILQGAKEIANADGGSLYLKGEAQTLDFKIVLNDSLGFAEGGTSGNPIHMPAVQLYDSEGKPNLHNVVTSAYHSGSAITIDDAYDSVGYDFSGTREFDALNGYRSTSFLTVPLTLQGSEIFGALQLINRLDPANGQVVPFDTEIRSFVEALSSLAAAVLYSRKLVETQRNLVLEQRRLVNSMIQLVAGAVDAKSPYTGAHCARVPIIADMLAKEAEATTEGPLASFSFSTEADREAFRMAAWLHDAGKMTTPEFVMDKAVKLETIYNRIHEVRTRFEVLSRDAVIEELEAVISGEYPSSARERREEKQRQLAEDFAFVAACNDGEYQMAAADEKRLRRIAERRWWRSLDPSLGMSFAELQRFERNAGSREPGWESVLADRPEHRIEWIVDREPIYRPYGFALARPPFRFDHGELHNLLIPGGTLTSEERYTINEHVIQTIVMLDRLPFPSELESIREYAGAHHEALNGNGYPRGIGAEQISMPSRIMAIADIFEALTAPDRPYKRAKTLSEAVETLYGFKKRGHIDPDVFDLFLRSGVFRKYAEGYLAPSQLDEVDIEPYLGPVDAGPNGRDQQ